MPRIRSKHGARAAIAVVRQAELVYSPCVSESCVSDALVGAQASDLAGESHCPSAPTRVVICGDALPWLAQRQSMACASFVTSLPDVSAFPHSTIAQWKEWFIAAARAVLLATPDEGVTIFYQTDVKREGQWVDKAYLCQRAAEELGVGLLWHKIVCRKPPGAAVYGRPGFTHLLCFARVVRDRPAPYPDVLPSTGLMTWSQAMGIAACELACRYVLSHTTTRTVVDPFCGVGSVLAVANSMGMNAVGVEMSNKRARKARGLLLPASWE